MKTLRTIFGTSLVIILIGITFALPSGPIVAATTAVPSGSKPDFSTPQSGIKIAPGESLPISINISNFGGSGRVDVLIKYEIYSDSRQVIATANDTMAIETTASFVKMMLIPSDAQPGAYVAMTSLTYPGHLTPVTTQFSFIIERKLLGLGQSDFYKYSGITLGASLLMVLLGYVLLKRLLTSRFRAFDYSHVPLNQRTFFEIISDTIRDMRQQVGDNALLIAASINGLEIDANDGRVVALNGKPSKIIADLVAQYENVLGKKVSFSFRPAKTKD